MAGILAANEIDAKYRRTIVGPLWILVVHVAWTGSLFMVSSGLFGSDPATYLPYLITSVTMWNLVAAALSAGPMLYTKSAGHIQSFPFPLAVYPLQATLTNLIVMAHQSIVVVAILLYFNLIMNVNLPLLIAAMIVICAFATGASMIFGLLGARFRDTGPLMESVTLVLFLLTPIFWQKQFLKDHHWLVDYNPLAQLLEIGRSAVLGQPPSAWAWGISIAFAGLTLAIGVLAHMKYRSKIAFWIT